jgi:hypothetical protein
LDGTERLVVEVRDWSVDPLARLSVDILFAEGVHRVQVKVGEDIGGADGENAIGDNAGDTLAAQEEGKSSVESWQVSSSIGSGVW